MTEINAPAWYVMRAYKCENKAEELLSGPDGLEFFIPKHYVVRIYHGVKSKRLVPVIPSLVFIHATKEELLAFKRRNNFIQFVMKGTGPDPLIVPDRQMNDFIKVATSQLAGTTYYNPEEINLQKGTPVRIHGGHFDGVTGTFLKIQGKRNRRLVVLLDGIMAVAAEIDPELVEVIGSF